MNLSGTSRKRLTLGLSLFLGLLAFKYLFPVLVPFLLGLSAALLLSPMISWLQRKFHLRHKTAAVLSVLTLLSLLGGILFGLGKLLLVAVSRLYQQAPVLLSGISAASSAIAGSIESFSLLLPGSAGDAFRSWSENLVSASGTLAATLYEKFFTLVSGLLGKLPDYLLMALTTLLACFFSAGELPRIREQLLTRLSPGARNRTQQLLHSTKTVVGNYFRAQLQLLGITFLILSGGFILLREQSPVLLALGISLLDALPVFGTGTVLLPWSLGKLLIGHTGKGIALLLLYAIAALTRNALEPRLLGRQMGISPLYTLFAIYAGYRFSGLGGMLLFPILLMVGAELYRISRIPLPGTPTKESPRVSFFSHTENSGG